MRAVRSDAPLQEREAIVAIVSARLKRLTGDADDPALAEAIRDADRRYECLPDGSALARLMDLFGATETDRAIMLTALAAEFEPSLLELYRRLSGRAAATEWLASRLFAGDLQLSSSSALLRWQLVTPYSENPSEPPALIPDRALRAWMSERCEIPLRLSAKARFLDPPPPLPGWPLDEIQARIKRAVGRLPAFLTVAGLEGMGRATFAANLAKRLGMQAILVDPLAGGTPWTSDDTMLVQRLALVANAALVWRSVPAAGSLAPPDRQPPSLQVVTAASGDPVQPVQGLTPFALALPPMSSAERATLLCEEVTTSANWSVETRRLLASREALTPGAIRRLAQIAPETDAEAIEATNASQAALMGGLAERMTSEVGWSDLILPDPLTDDLKDLAFEARFRQATWDQPQMSRLFPRERGLVALFYGAPGTGKTMAAQVVSRAMGVDLFRIDCSAVISKYIGETSKNLAAIFARARQMDAVIFFDEADALFSRRTDIKDSNDRYANSDTATLLQLIESQFDGTALLATNRKANLDPAFLRRIRYTFEFPRPSPEARAEIWERAALALSPVRAEALSRLWPVLGRAIDFTGAQIKTTLLSAHFAAARVDQALGPSQILRAAERELIKEGRTLGSRDRDRINAYA